MKKLALAFALLALPSLASEFLEGYGHCPSNDVEYLVVDQNGVVYPTNAVATVQAAAATAARVAAAEQAAIAYTNAAAQTSAAVDDLAKAIIDGNVVVYEDDFVYSLGTAVTVSTNCHCFIYRYDAQAESVTVSGVPCWRSWLYFGFTENVSALTPVAQFRNSLDPSLDWQAAVCGEPEPQNHTFTRDGEQYDFCYRLYVDVPKTESPAFFRVFTDVPVQAGDGSVLELFGGFSGGRTETVPWGDATLVFRGGLSVWPTQEEAEP